ncbi:PepSY domain-containing protein [Candidatus Magnetaquicoccus inordinatus]|uniref:PepSY domain-containing protein n=1 Tax=Candidatus Magnetaquicoccus inordinatus TaxID=2496818 RepID=UPI00102C9377|nr:hypothetical protein [Candidatus Magnetaquicoccus inordinatus]
MSVALLRGKRSLLSGVLFGGALLGFDVSLGSLWADRGEHGDHDRARHLMRKGEILPLEQIVSGLAQHGKGRLLAVELQQKQGQWIYEIQYMDEQGRLLEEGYDARSGRLLYSKEEEGEKD